MEVKLLIWLSKFIPTAVTTMASFVKWHSHYSTTMHTKDRAYHTGLLTGKFDQALSPYEKGGVKLLMAVSRWNNPLVKVYYANNMGISVNKVDIQHYPSVCLITEMVLEVSRTIDGGSKC